MTTQLDLIRDALFNESSITKIDLSRIYCQFTGAPIASLSPSVFLDIAESGKFDLSDASDRAEFVEQCFDRLMASSRPSPAWNYITVNTIDSMRTVNPLETLCYLWNRLTAPLDPNHLKNPRWKYARIIEHRVLAYNSFLMLARAGLLTESLTNRLIESLLRIDVFSNLAMVTWQGKPVPALDSTPESFEQWVASVESFSMDERDAGLRRMELGHTSPLNSSNSSSRKAYIAMFLEGRRSAPSDSDDTPAKPRKAVDPEKAKRRTAMANRVSDMLREITGATRTYSVPKTMAAPPPSINRVLAPKPSTPITFAAKLAMAKAARESQGES